MGDSKAPPDRQRRATLATHQLAEALALRAALASGHRADGAPHDDLDKAERSIRALLREVLTPQDRAHHRETDEMVFATTSRRGCPHRHPRESGDPGKRSVRCAGLAVSHGFPLSRE